MVMPCFRNTSIYFLDNKQNQEWTHIHGAMWNYLTGSNTWWQVPPGTMRQSPILPNGCRKTKIADAPKMHQERSPASLSCLLCSPEVLLLLPGPSWRWENELNSPEPNPQPSHHPSCNIHLETTESRNGLCWEGS